jgi:ribonuclease HI
MAEREVEIYADGACRGNPGLGGWGVLLRSGRRERELRGGEPQTTNNRMELTAVIEGLAALKGRRRVRVYTDSQYVQKGISEWIHDWKRRGWRTAGRTAVKNADLWRRLEELARAHEVEWHWIRGHAGHPENERADALANAGIDQLLRRSRESGNPVDPRSRGDDDRSEEQSPGRRSRESGNPVDRRSRGDDDRREGQSPGRRSRESGNPVDRRLRGDDDRREGQSPGRRSRESGNAVDRRWRGDDDRREEQSPGRRSRESGNPVD